MPRRGTAPYHIGDPAAIGADLANPMTGQPVKEIGDFYWRSLFNVTSAAQQVTTYATKLSGSAGLSADQSPILRRLWTKALAEWT